MTSIYLVRHGETDWNAEKRIQGASEIPLNETGRRQARAAAAMLRNGDWRAVYSSPLSRALETAEIICAELSIDTIIPDEVLMERSFGAAEGMTAAECQQRYPDRVIPGAESWDQVLERAMAFLQRLAAGTERLPGHSASYLVVTHGGFINSILRFMESQGMGPGRIALDNASATLLRYDGSWDLVWYNRTEAIMQETHP